MKFNVILEIWVRFYVSFKNPVEIYSNAYMDFNVPGVPHMPVTKDHNTDLFTTCTSHASATESLEGTQYSKQAVITSPPMPSQARVLLHTAPMPSLSPHCADALLNTTLRTPPLYYVDWASPHYISPYYRPSTDEQEDHLDAVSSPE